MSLSLEAGEADYFSAILAMQNDVQPSMAMPDALKDLVEQFKNAVQSESVSWNWPKPNLLSADDLVAFSATKNLMLFLKKDENKTAIFALSQSTVSSLSCILLGGKPIPLKPEPSRMETLISIGFIKLIDPAFIQVEAPQTAFSWKDFVGAKLALGEEPDSAFIVVMINRRADAGPVHDIRKTDVRHQNHIRNTIGNSVLNLEYVLDGGAVSLALLRNLSPGSVLPLASLADAQLRAKANGRTVFSGVLKLTAEQMAMKVGHVLAEAGHE